MVDICGICRDTLDFGLVDNIEVLACRHVFHRVCVYSWLSRVLECPLCRSAVTHVNLSECIKMGILSSENEIVDHIIQNKTGRTEITEIIEGGSLSASSIMDLIRSDVDIDIMNVIRKGYVDHLYIVELIFMERLSVSSIQELVELELVSIAELERIMDIYAGYFGVYSRVPAIINLKSSKLKYKYIRDVLIESDEPDLTELVIDILNLIVSDSV